MDDNAIFYLLVLAAAVAVVFLWAQKTEEIKQNESEQQRQLAKRLVTETIKKKQFPKDEQERRKLNVTHLMGQFHVERFGQDIAIEQVWGVFQVASMSERGVQYRVDIGGQTCECENFKKRRSHPRNHVARWCKHLLGAFDEVGAFNTLEGMQAEVVKFEYTQCDKMYLIKHDDLPEMVITLSDDSLSRDWMDLYARKKCVGENIKQASGSFKRFGWNLYQERWSYNDGPPGASLLRPLFKIVDATEIEDLLETMCDSSKVRS